MIFNDLRKIYPNPRKSGSEVTAVWHPLGHTLTALRVRFSWTGRLQFLGRVQPAGVLGCSRYYLKLRKEQGHQLSSPFRTIHGAG